MKKLKSLFSFGTKKSTKDAKEQEHNDSDSSKPENYNNSNNINDYILNSYSNNSDANNQQNQASNDEPQQQTFSVAQSTTDIQSLAARSIRVTFPKSGNQEEHDKNLQSILNTLPGIVNVRILSIRLNQFHYSYELFNSLDRYQRTKSSDTFLYY